MYVFVYLCVDAFVCLCKTTNMNLCFCGIMILWLYVIV